MQKLYSIPASACPVYDHCDVLVVGGGPAGCAAAIGAARHGAKVLLAEACGHLGGAAVNQDVAVVLSTNRQDLCGVWHTYMRRLLALGGAYAKDFAFSGVHYTGIVDPEIVKTAWRGLLAEQGVRVLYHAACVGVMKNDSAISGGLFATRAGILAISADRVIDATGDGMVCHYAGAAYDQGMGDKPYAMAATKVLRLGGVPEDAGPRDEQALEAVRKAYQDAVARGEFRTPLMTSGRVLRYIHPNRLAWHMGGHRQELLLVIGRVLRVDPLDPASLSAAEDESRAQALEIADFYRRYVPGCENSYLESTAAQLGIRASRRVVGIETIGDEAAQRFAKHPESIARSSWELDVWPADSYTAPAVDLETEAHRQRLAALRSGEYFDIPYGCLVPRGTQNLLAAGRCLSAGPVAQSSLRIQQTCMATGEAAGMAAALSIKQGLSPAALDGTALSKTLWAQRAAVKPCGIWRAPHNIQNA